MEPHASFYKQGNLVLDLIYGEIGSSTKTLPYYELYGWLVSECFRVEGVERECVSTWQTELLFVWCRAGMENTILSSSQLW